MNIKKRPGYGGLVETLKVSLDPYKDEWHDIDMAGPSVNDAICAEVVRWYTKGMPPRWVLLGWEADRILAYEFGMQVEKLATPGGMVEIIVDPFHARTLRCLPRNSEALRWVGHVKPASEKADDIAALRAENDSLCRRLAEEREAHANLRRDSARMYQEMYGGGSATADAEPVPSRGPAVYCQGDWEP